VMMPPSRSTKTCRARTARKNLPSVVKNDGRFAVTGPGMLASGGSNQAIFRFQCLTDQPPGIQALIALMDDVDSDVRDWATFGLAHLEEDSPEIRAALWARVEDSDDDTRCQALRGLALRRDLAITSHIAAELGAEFVSFLALEAAKSLAQPALLPALLRLQAAYRPSCDEDVQLLEQALQACSPQQH
jgi:HEAT repeat protein